MYVYLVQLLLENKFREIAKGWYDCHLGFKCMRFGCQVVKMVAYIKESLHDIIFKVSPLNKKPEDKDVGSIDRP